MEHVFFALFERADAATAAIRALMVLGTRERRVELIVHHGEVDEGTMAVQETRARMATQRGALLGALFGALMGAMLVGPFGLRQTVSVPELVIVMSTVSGTVLGALGGVLSGSADPQTVFRRHRLDLKNGMVLLTVIAPTLSQKEEAERVCERYRARLEGRD